MLIYKYSMSFDGLVDVKSTFEYTGIMKPGKVRAIALCVFINNGKLFVGEGFDVIKQQAFCRPLGGTIEFGESSHDTIVREIKEEIGAKITNLKLLGLLENIFTYNGETGHEIVLIYRGEFIDQKYYNRSPIEGIEDGHPIRAIWVPVEDFAQGKIPLYPSGLLDMVQKEVKP